MRIFKVLKDLSRNVSDITYKGVVVESSTLICIICLPTVEAPGLIIEVTANNRRSKDEVVGRPL